MLVLRVRALGSTRLERPVELDIDRTVLYGPNAAGKSFIIRALAYLLPSEGVRDNLVFEVRNVGSYSRLFGYAGVELCEDNKCATLESDGINFKVKEAVWRHRHRTTRIFGDCIYPGTALRCTDIVHEFEDLRSILSEPTIAEATEKFLHHYYIELGIERFHGNYFREFVNGEHEWHDIILLPYGIKRAIATPNESFY